MISLLRRPKRLKLLREQTSSPELSFSNKKNDVEVLESTKKWPEVIDADWQPHSDKITAIHLEIQLLSARLNSANQKQITRRRNRNLENKCVFDKNICTIFLLNFFFQRIEISGRRNASVVLLSASGERVGAVSIIAAVDAGAIIADLILVRTAIIIDTFLALPP